MRWMFLQNTLVCSRTCKTIPASSAIVFKESCLRSRPPLTGVLRGPGLRVPHGVLFEQFWALASECPKECFSSAFLAKAPKSTRKALFGTLQGKCPKIAQKALRGALSGPGPGAPPVNGGRDRKIMSNHQHKLVPSRKAVAFEMPICHLRKAAPWKPTHTLSSCTRCDISRPRVTDDIYYSFDWDVISQDMPGPPAQLCPNRCELFFPLQSPRGGNPRKMGKNYKIPLPGPTAENGEKLPKNYKKYSKNTFFVIFR